MKEGGLYVPEKRMWLNESKLLISYAGLLSTVVSIFIFFHSF